MQTFLPYADFAESAMTLDTKRLGKQIVESRQIGLALTRTEYGWKSHPAVKMWTGCVPALMEYTAAMAAEWHDRRGKQHGAWLNMQQDHEPDAVVLPEWLGRHDVHNSHRSNLVRKAPEHYRKFWPHIPDNLEYIWPI